jgi:hypothetical protein
MKTMTANLIRRFALLTLAVLTAAVPATVLGQEEERSRDDRTVIEILDGRILVDGEEVDDEDGRVVIEGKDGKHTIILRSGDGGYAYWMGDPDEATAEFFARWNENHPQAFWDKEASRRLYDLEGNHRSWENLPEDATDTVWKFFNDGTAALESLGDHFGGTRLFDLEGQNERLREEMEIARLETEARDLAAQIRRAEGAERSTLEQEFDQKLNEIFDRKLAVRQERAEKLAEDLDELQAALQERREARSSIIEHRKRQLLGDEDHLKW